MNKPKILIIYTGGTIGMIRDYESKSLIPFNFDLVFDKIPEIQQLNCELNYISIRNPIDSSNMNPQIWIEIVNIIEDFYNKVDGFVVLHGSDTMSYTASALSFMLENLKKPVVFTGSQLPLGDLRTDAKENLITSIHIAASQKNGVPKIQEVSLYFEYQLYRANRTTKLSSEHFEAFVSMNFPPLATSGVHLNFHRQNLRPKNNPLVIHKTLNTDVALLKLFPGIKTHWYLEALLQSSISLLIIETYGSGNASNNSNFIQFLKSVLDKDVLVINNTQCLRGSVSMEIYESGKFMNELGIISAFDMTLESTITKSMVLLGLGYKGNEFKREFQSNKCGEISNI